MLSIYLPACLGFFFLHYGRLFLLPSPECFPSCSDLNFLGRCHSLSRVALILSSELSDLLKSAVCGSGNCKSDTGQLQKWQECVLTDFCRRVHCRSNIRADTLKAAFSWVAIGECDTAEPLLGHPSDSKRHQQHCGRK